MFSIAERVAEMEKINAAAIKWRMKNDLEENIIQGCNHASCLNWFSFADISSKERDMEFEEQGFVTNSGRFVNREEALIIAQKAGQVRKGYANRCLYSEYVNYSA